MRLVFYPISDALSANWPPPIPQAPPPDLIMAIHYFGMPTDMAAAVGFARGTGAVLIEDAAHALLPGPRVGHAGDFVLYCPRKTLAIPDGAVLIASPAEARLVSSESTGPAPSALAWLVKRAIQRMCPSSLAAVWMRSRLMEFDADPAFASLPETSAVSDCAKRLIGHVILRLSFETAARQANWRTLAESLAGREDIQPLWSSDVWTNMEAAPYRFLMRAQNRARAVWLYDRLRNRGVPVETWPDLAPEVRAAPKQHEAAYKLRQTVLMLPLHGGIDIEEVAQRLRSAIS